MNYPSCPRCTRLKRNHAELNQDVIAFPVFLAGRHGARWDLFNMPLFAPWLPEYFKTPKTRWLVKDGCEHARRLDAGEWTSEKAIIDAWLEIVEQLKK